MITEKELADSLKQAVGTMKHSNGCYEIPLEGKLSIFVGWSDGYDPEDPTVIHAEDEPSYALVMGIKVNTSDDMRTDYDYINYPYCEDGDVWDDGLSVDPKTENFAGDARWFLKEFATMSKFDMDDDGKVLNTEAFKNA